MRFGRVIHLEVCLVPESARVHPAGPYMEVFPTTAADIIALARVYREGNSRPDLTEHKTGPSPIMVEIKAAEKLQKEF